MRLLVLKVCALAIALAVALFVIQASRSRGLDPAEPAAAASASSAGDRRSPPASRDAIIGPATKVDPHTMRRAAESLERSVGEAPAAAPSSSATP